ncbi:unnamed protein product [Spirodela intermedia]|uniref:Phosphofructokinase domain-containing protein n=1 Tax=Spirodela intermedia TaxID=51605 RepID=A0A7I8IV96_SPIIN|nr:unnamed protein product [Spirodela intermedia]CAA6661552.1 unnamed protein product [Spirodela intermedia]
MDSEAPPIEDGDGGDKLKRLSSNAFSLSSINLQKVPHLCDYLPDLSTRRNPIDNSPFYHPRPSFYVVLPLPEPPPPGLPPRGPRETVFFEPAAVRAAIVTCGGLCPGLNTVIRELVVGLWDIYGVREIYGIRDGYRGFYSSEPLRLDPKVVDGWHKRGGTALATSRGGFDLERIVAAVEARGFNQIFIIGGDGSMRGAAKIFEEVRRRRLKVAVAGIPKTVDNDIGIIDRSFGFQTAVETAQQAISAAHVEAESAVNGVGLVKLMGRSTGHIALHATLSSCDVDCCLIPENGFFLEGPGGLFEFLRHRLRQNGHAVVVVAEGAGQDLIPPPPTKEKDPSGNRLLRELFTVKYIDPTYMIRAVPANATDNLYCTLLAHSAIHGAMAGYTGFVSGPINGIYAYIPVEEVAEARNLVDTSDHKWAWVRSVTNQPDFSRDSGA